VRDRCGQLSYGGDARCSRQFDTGFPQMVLRSLPLIDIDADPKPLYDPPVFVSHGLCATQMPTMRSRLLVGLRLEFAETLARTTTRTTATIPIAWTNQPSVAARSMISSGAPKCLSSRGLVFITSALLPIHFSRGVGGFALEKSH
jgi:hypothetical protein